MKSFYSGFYFSDFNFSDFYFASCKQSSDFSKTSYSVVFIVFPNISRYFLGENPTLVLNTFENV